MGGVYSAPGRTGSAAEESEERPTESEVRPVARTVLEGALACDCLLAACTGAFLTGSLIFSLDNV